MMLSRTHSLALALTLAFVAAGCDDDDDGSDVTTPDDSITQEDLAGSWNVSSSQCTSITDPGVVFDLFTNGGAGIIAVTVAPNGQYTYTTQYSDPTRTPTTANGTLAVGADGTITDTQSDASSGVATTVESSDNGDTLTLVQQNTTFDFDEDPGTPTEPASCVQTWTRSTTTES